MELNGLRNIVQSSGPMAYTTAALTKAFKETWNSEALMKAFDLEIEGATLDTQMAMNKQFYSGLQGQARFTGNEVYVPIPARNINMSPIAVHARQARQDQMLLAAKKRKPSYRQRQKNGRAGRKK